MNDAQRKALERAVGRWDNHAPGDIIRTGELAEELAVLARLELERGPERGVELDARGEAMICDGCGTTRTLAAVKASHGPQAIACCPERKMVPAREVWRKAESPPQREKEGFRNPSGMSMRARLERHLRYALDPLACNTGKGEALAQAIVDSVLGILDNDPGRAASSTGKLGIQHYRTIIQAIRRGE